MSLSPSSSQCSLLCGEDADEWKSNRLPSPSSPSSIQYPPLDETTLDSLIKTETHHIPDPDYLNRLHNRSIHITSRQDSINWIRKVHALYNFKPVTQYLSINYLDRFLSTNSLPQKWAFQLLSVACLSLAAKMGETHVPLLLDLQVLDPKFVFEPKTVQRMELWVMANLHWRLLCVTPFDFLDYFASKIVMINPRLQSHLCSNLCSSASDHILSTTRVVDFLRFTPSTIAAAAVLCAAGEGVDLPDSDGSYFERVNKVYFCWASKAEMVRSCHQLMEEYLVDTCPSAKFKAARSFEPALEPFETPRSPVAVLDAAAACGSCESQKFGLDDPSSSQAVEAEAEPPNKRLRSSAPDVQQS
ncbi:Cyclin, N-terminal [Dillenia turbinata]|uniref:Cyclin, N-terminal n=1 Tax=Dillenia turbinata TaxID=194707 RepID=A0AAN8W4E2_9MAGN